MSWNNRWQGENNPGIPYEERLIRYEEKKK
jgi:hypothetical protein